MTRPPGKSLKIFNGPRSYNRPDTALVDLFFNAWFFTMTFLNLNEVRDRG